MKPVDWFAWIFVQIIDLFVFYFLVERILQREHRQRLQSTIAKSQFHYVTATILERYETTSGSKTDWFIVVNYQVEERLCARQ